MERLIKSAGDQRAFLNQLRALRNRGLIRIALERADAYRDKIPLRSIPGLIGSLSKLSDELESPEPGFGFFFSDLLMIAWRLIYFGLRREKKLKQFQLLHDAFTETDAILLPLEIVTNEQRSQERDNRGFEYLVDESEF